MRAVQKIVLAICLLILANTSFGQNKIIETFPEGQIDWVNMTISATGMGQLDRELPPARERISAVSAARDDAGLKLLAVVKQLNLDSETSVESFLNQSEIANNRVQSYFTEFKIIGKPRLMPDSSVELTAEISITGDILNVVLPVSVDNMQIDLATIPTSKSEKTAYTGLIIDCRDLDISPALFPRVLDENGHEVFSSSRVDRSAVIKSGLVEYFHDGKQPERLGGNPYKVKALQISGPNNCDAIILADDAVVINSMQENMMALNKCKVVFLLK